VPVLIKSHCRNAVTFLFYRSGEYSYVSN